jgi:threonine dehydrogenase-like Zn-dependent dehydrogenase
MVVEPGKVGIVDYELPELKPGQVRVKSEFASAKHGTEMAGFKGYAAHRGRFDKEMACFIRPEKPEPPGPFKPGGTGNMFVGKVTELGQGVTDFAVGDRVLSYGGFREVQTVDAGRCWRMPPKLSWKSGVCLDPSDFAMAAVRDGNVRVGDVVAVFGLGAIGLMAIQICRLSGAHPVIAVDPLPIRRRAAEKCGADAALDPAKCDAGLEIRKLTSKRGADVVIEYSGSVHALQAAIRAVAFGGNVVAGAFPAPYPAGLDLGAEAHLNIPNIIFSRACSEPNREHPRWDEKRVYATCWRLICEGKLTGEPVVEPVVPFESLPTEYPKIATDPGSNIKLGVKFP